MRLLAFETSCDETSVAAVDGDRILSNVVSSQVRLHAEYGGVVPELAARAHLRNLPWVAREALAGAHWTPADVQGVAATLGPGLPQALMVGARAAQMFAWSAGVPFVGVNHHEAHLYSPWIAGSPPLADLEGMTPHVSLIASGGHTLLLHVAAPLQHRVLGSTLDDAAGECFDKTAKLLGLPYPGGPEMDRLAREGRSDAYEFPRPLLRDGGDDFSFSGLKTSVRTFLARRPGLADSPQALRDLCASVQAAIVEILVAKLVGAAIRERVDTVTASGGVTCNSAFRALLERSAARAGLQVRLALPALCTDNAGMIGVLAGWKLQRGDATPLDAGIRPNWDLADARSG